MRSTAEIRELLEAHSFFGEMSEGDLEALLSHARTEHYPARQIIFTKGSPGRSMMAVVRGRIKISLPSVGGRELVLASLGVGEIFGEMALLDGSERTADATAMTDCDLLVLDHRDFIPFLERRPDLCINLLRLFCRRLRQTNEHVEGALFERLVARLAKALVHLSSSGSGLGEAQRIQISQAELASLVGASRESVNKQLHAWQRVGLLEIHNREIAILDRKRFENWADHR